MFKDKTALVIGGGRDIGRAVSIALAKEGAKVMVNYANDEGAARDTAKEIEAAGGKAAISKADATSYADMERLAKETVAFGGGVDILVNVVGGLVARTPFAEMDPEFFDKVIRLNVHSVFNAVRASLPHMKEGGAIVNFSSQAGRDGGGPGAGAYATSKGAIMTMTRAMAKEFGPKGVRVNAVCPGLINTSFHDRFTKSEVRAKVAGGTPLGREGHAEEVADLVLYLASDRASYITGACFDINGGSFYS